MSNTILPFTTATSNVAGVAGALPGTALTGTWNVVASTLGQTDWMTDITVPAGITAARVVVSGTIFPTAIAAAYSVQVGVQFCDAGGATNGVLGPHQLWASTLPANRRLTTSTLTQVRLTWTIHPTDIATYAGRNLRVFVVMNGATIALTMSTCRLEYTTDPSQQASSPRALSPAETAALLAVTPTGVTAKIGDLPGAGVPSPTAGWSSNAALSLQAATGLNHGFSSLVAVDLPPTTDPLPLISAGVRHYRKAQTSGTQVSTNNQAGGTNIVLWDRSTGTIFGIVPGTGHPVTQPPQLHEYNAMSLWTGRGDTADLAYATQSDVAAAAAAGTLSVMFGANVYDEAPAEGFRQAYNEVLLGAFATVVGTVPLTIVGCTVVSVHFGHLCTDDISIIGLEGSIGLTASPGARHIPTQAVTGKSAFLANFRSTMMPNASNGLYSRPLPPNSEISPAGSSYQMNATATTSNGERHSYHLAFTIAAGAGDGPIDLQGIGTP